MTFFVLWMLGACSADTIDTSLCNGANLCAEAFHTATVLGTHNSAASTAYNFIADVNANQSTTITQQLEDGIRLLMLDIYEEDGEHLLCHGPCLLGAIPHQMVLEEIATFMHDNPREVLSIIYQNDISSDEIALDLDKAGMSNWLFTFDGVWPTLGEMVAADQRLVVTVEVDGGTPPSIPNVWTLAWDTNYTWTDLDAFDCDLNRGDLSNEVLLLNHWVSTGLGTPDLERAAQANTASAILGHTDQCPRPPTWIAVDFYERSDPFEAVRILNGL